MKRTTLQILDVLFLTYIFIVAYGLFRTGYFNGTFFALALFFLMDMKKGFFTDLTEIDYD